MSLFRSWLQKEIDALGSGATGAGMEATPFTVEEMPDTYNGDGAIMSVLVFPTANPVIAFKIEGDDFPRFVWTADHTLAFGDGTVDPIAGTQGVLGLDPDGGLYLSGTKIRITNPVLVDGDVTLSAAHGAVVLSPDNTKFRIVVDNTGSLNTEPVV